MPGHLRTRLRRALTGAEGHGPLSKIKSKSSKNSQPESDFYLPGEKMPPMKYRRAVDPEHKKTLEAFSFSTAWRRRSQASLYSPMGSRLPSRRGSFRSRRSRSRSMARSRRSSVVSLSSDYDAEEWVDSGIGASIAGDDRPDGIKEASDDEGDVLNVGLSRNPTEDPRDAKRKQSTVHRRSSSTQLATRPGTGSDITRRASQPFSPEDLELALQKSHLEATKEESDKSDSCTPCEEFDEPSPFLRPRGGSIYVPYDGQGTPPKLPFWGNAYPDSEGDSPVLSPRRASMFAVPTARNQSVFATMSEEDTASDDTASESDSEPARSTAICVPNDSACECPPEQDQKHPKAKPQPCYPCDAIAAILARSDI